MKDKKLRIMVCCANGIGSSLMMKMTVQKVLEKTGLAPEEIRHCDLREGVREASGYDAVLCAGNFVTMFQEAYDKGIPVIGLENLLSVQEMEQKMRVHNII